MLTPGRSLALHSEAGRELPRVPALARLYEHGCRPRYGEAVMIAGRPGAQKSGFALFWVASMGLPALYFSADMSPFQASVRLAAMATGDTVDHISESMQDPSARARYAAAVEQYPITFCFDKPITWRSVDEELEAYVELWNTFPEVLVFDNLMDFDGATTEYQEQMAVMSGISDLAREIGATPVILHHATDKSAAAKMSPWQPAPRDEIKGGLAEKPELTLSVAIDPTDSTFRVAVVKQRMGPSDPSAQSYAVLFADPARNRFDSESPFQKATRLAQEGGAR